MILVNKEMTNLDHGYVRRSYFSLIEIDLRILCSYMLEIFFLLMHAHELSLT